MFLASFNGFGPIASVFLFVVEQTADAELFDGSSVPAGPVADAGRFVAEDAVLPVARAAADGRVGKLFVLAQVAPPGIVAVLEESASTTGENQAIGTVKVLGFTIDAFPVTIAVSDISHDFALGLAGIRLPLPVATMVGA